jgi:hypothetical protein
MVPILDRQPCAAVGVAPLAGDPEALRHLVCH